jgi:hypothetical protein
MTGLIQSIRRRGVRLMVRRFRAAWGRASKNTR